MTKPKLKPCPFCKKKEVVVSRLEAKGKNIKPHGKKVWLEFYFGECPISINFHGKDIVVGEYNGRDEVCSEFSGITGCGACGPIVKGELKAIEAWNRRA